jgi:hypothetical protein
MASWPHDAVEISASDPVTRSVDIQVGLSMVGAPSTTSNK